MHEILLGGVLEAADAGHHRIIGPQRINPIADDIARMGGKGAPCEEAEARVARKAGGQRMVETSQARPGLNGGAERDRALTGELAARYLRHHQIKAGDVGATQRLGIAADLDGKARFFEQAAHDVRAGLGLVQFKPAPDDQCLLQTTLPRSLLV